MNCCLLASLKRIEITDGQVEHVGPHLSTVHAAENWAAIFARGSAFINLDASARAAHNLTSDIVCAKSANSWCSAAKSENTTEHELKFMFGAIIIFFSNLFWFFFAVFDRISNNW